MSREVPWLYRNPRTGRRVRGEFPNTAMFAFQSSFAASVFVPDDDVAAVARDVAFFSLMWWAADELIRGHSPFRRLIGLATIVVVGGLAALPSRSSSR